MLAPGAPFPLSNEDAARTGALSARIRARIAEHGGWLPFSAFMQAALYEPELGYYMAEHPIFGGAGDFTTAPELSPLFAACLSHAVESVFAATSADEIVELGAGSGRMPGELFGTLAGRGHPPSRYRIVEPSPALAQRQRDHLSAAPTTAPYFDRFEWLASPPAPGWSGVAIANEVVDAIAVDRFRIVPGGCESIGVVSDGANFQWMARPADSRLAGAVSRLQSGLSEPMRPGFTSELRPLMTGWVRGIASGMTQGALLVIDYGLPRAQYYHASRDGGTLCGFHRHHRVDNPLASPGLQDLTAWVDFSALADAAVTAGLAVGGFATQAHFLLESGLEGELARLTANGSEAERAAIRQSAATMLLPGEMGERFKVMALTRGIATSLAGFGFRDLSASL